jgi:hypothetical protein
LAKALLVWDEARCNVSCKRCMCCSCWNR